MFKELHRSLPGAEWDVASPGRVNLLGEHVDYNDGIVLPVAIDKRVYLTAKKRNDNHVLLHALDFNEKVVFDLDDIEKRKDIKGNPLPEWALYPAGVAWALKNEGFHLNGFEAAYKSDFPIGAGLSSSAAVETAFGVLWQKLGGWETDRMHLAKICQYAENYFVGVNCGLMDQFSSLHGIARHALFFDTRSLTWKPLPLPNETGLVIADSNARRKLANSAYNERRETCEKAVEILNGLDLKIDSLRDLSPYQFKELSDSLPEKIRKRTEHVVMEIERVRKASVYLLEENPEEFGRLMVEGHESLRDLYEVSIEELDGLVEIALDLEGCYGSRLTGAGFGGCTVNLVQKEKSEVFSRKLAERYQKRFNNNADIYICQASRGTYIEAP